MFVENQFFIHSRTPLYNDATYTAIGRHQIYNIGESIFPEFSALYL